MTGFQLATIRFQVESLKRGDRVSDGRREGTLLGVYCDAIAWIRWETDPCPSYVPLADLSKIARLHHLQKSLKRSGASSV